MMYFSLADPREANLRLPQDSSTVHPMHKPAGTVNHIMSKVHWGGGGKLRIGSAQPLSTWLR